MPNVVGIDVSKATLAICSLLNGKVQHQEVTNTKAGFQKLVKSCGQDCLFIM